MLFLLFLSLSLLLLLLTDHRSFGERFAVLDQKVGIADPESPEAATDVPCHVGNVVALMLLPLTLSVRKRVASKFRCVTSNLGRVTCDQ